MTRLLFRHTSYFSKVHNVLFKAVIVTHRIGSSIEQMMDCRSAGKMPFRGVDDPCCTIREYWNIAHPDVVTVDLALVGRDKVSLFFLLEDGVIETNQLQDAHCKCTACQLIHRPSSDILIVNGVAEIPRGATTTAINTTVSLYLLHHV